MSGDWTLSNTADVDESFASGILALFNEFCGVGGAPGDVLVRITLVNAEEYYFKGLRVDLLSNVPGCVMLRGLDADDESDALVIREDHILRAEFDRSPPPAQRFGF